MGLREYNRKRDFSITPEPPGDAPAPADEGRSYLIQKHRASHLHYDFRIELEGVLKSWSVPKGPSLDPAVRRLAMQTEDHPISYGSFEGTIPKGQYGGGTVMLWDRGTWEPTEDPHHGFHAGKLKFRLHGERLKGLWALIKTHRSDGDDERSWLLIKDRDEAAKPADTFDITEAMQESVVSGRSMDEIAAAEDRVWQSNRAGGSDEEKKDKPKAATEKGKGSAAEKPKEPAPAVDPGAIASSVSGAREARLPAKPKPQIAQPADAPPAGDKWIHEILIDGPRVLAVVQRDGVRLLDEEGEDRADDFPDVVEAIRGLGLRRAIFDGAVTAIHPDGSMSEPAPREERRAGSARKKSPKKARAEVAYLAFDMLYLEGYDLTEAPLEARKTALEGLLGKERVGSGPLRYWGHIVGSGEEVYEKACRLGATGILSKRRDAPYTRGESDAWLTLECVQPRKPKKRAAKRPARRRS